jgi:hypothetical protein
MITIVHAAGGPCRGAQQAAGSHLAGLRLREALRAAGAGAGAGERLRLGLSRFLAGERERLWLLPRLRLRRLSLDLERERSRPVVREGRGGGVSRLEP